MDIRHLRYFLAVAEELNFRQAAERLHISQPPLSMQIKAMEEEIGVPLFERTQRSVKLSPAGEFLVPHVRETISKFDQTRELANLAARGEAGRLRVGFTASVPMRHSFPATLRHFRDLYPYVKQEIFHSSTNVQLDMLKSGSLDVGFVRLPYRAKIDPHLAKVNMWRDELILYAAADSKWGEEQEPVPIETLAGEPFVSFSAPAGSFEQVSFLCSQTGFLPNVVQHGRDGTAILGFVAAGVGVAILPDIYIHTGISGIVTRKLASPDTKSFVVLAHRKEGYSTLIDQFKRAAIAETMVTNILPDDTLSGLAINAKPVI
ncbi:LysR family transcriptional regulator [Pseudogemmobacter sonorensis]|uniref:LysR family transcriptional regulator n=1 Tax=Pseudogemmobacter sonorensis TaxID=2989681 RepID=UPI00367E768A